MSIETMDSIILEKDSEDTLRNKYLSFQVRNEIYAFEIKYVTEIIGIQKITKIPNISPYVKGIINLRGNIIPVINVRNRFGLEEISYDDRTCIIVIKKDNDVVGLIVDKVSEVFNLTSQQITPPHSTKKGANGKFINGISKIDDEVIILLDINKVLYDSLEINIVDED